MRSKRRADKGNPLAAIGALTPANIIIEGGIVGYDTNIRTGGLGVNYLGIGGATQYRVDQVTIASARGRYPQRAGLNSVSTTKTIYSYELTAGVYKFVGYQNLLQVEAGMTSMSRSSCACAKRSKRLWCISSCRASSRIRGT